MGGATAATNVVHVADPTKSEEASTDGSAMVRVPETDPTSIASQRTERPPAHGAWSYRPAPPSSCVYVCTCMYMHTCGRTGQRRPAAVWTYAHVCTCIHAVVPASAAQQLCGRMHARVHGCVHGRVRARARARVRAWL